MEIGVSKADFYLIGQRREIQVALFRTRQTPNVKPQIGGGSHGAHGGQGGFGISLQWAKSCADCKPDFSRDPWLQDARFFAGAIGNNGRRPGRLGKESFLPKDFMTETRNNRTGTGTDTAHFPGGAVRGLRQRRAYYRCCIPALAGFVSQRSIAPDGSVLID
jgi:hypothetical protein